jgi:hypothetical protein
MKFTIGYFDKTGKYLGKECPKKNTTFFVAGGSFKKKIDVDEEATPYTREISKYSRKFNNENNINMTLFMYSKCQFKRIDRHSISYTDPTYRVVRLIEESLKKRVYYYARKYSVSRDYIFGPGGNL